MTRIIALALLALFTFARAALADTYLDAIVVASR